MSYSVWQSFITNGVKTISGAVVSVFHEGSGAPAALFSSPSGGAIGSSVTSDSSGLARFYVAAGVYRITVTHASFSAEHRHVRIGEMAGVDDAPSDGKQYARKDGDWEEVSVSDYIPSLTVTVGTGGDYTTWDAFFSDIQTKDVGDLTVTVSGSHTNSSAFYYFYRVFGALSITFSSATFSSGINIKNGVTNLIVLYGDMTCTSGSVTLSGAISPASLAITASTSITLDGSVVGGTFTTNATDTYLDGTIASINLTTSGKLHVKENANVIFDIVSVDDVIIIRGDTVFMSDITYTGSTLLPAFITVCNGAKVTSNYTATIDCGSGVTTAIKLAQQGTGTAVGGIVVYCGDFLGTYTNKYSQAPSVVTPDGVIFAPATVKTYSKKTSTLTSSSGVITIDCADGIDKHTITLSENVTSWSFTNRPTGTDYIVKIVAVTQDASTARTCVSPATKTAGSAWTVSSTLSSEEWLELWIGASDVYLRASGTMV